MNKDKIITVQVLSNPGPIWKNYNKITKGIDKRGGIFVEYIMDPGSGRTRSTIHGKKQGEAVETDGVLIKPSRVVRQPLESES